MPALFSVDPLLAWSYRGTSRSVSRLGGSPPSSVRWIIHRIGGGRRHWAKVQPATIPPHRVPDCRSRQCLSESPAEIRGAQTMHNPSPNRAVAVAHRVTSPLKLNAL